MWSDILSGDPADWLTFRVLQSWLAVFLTCGRIRVRGILALLAFRANIFVRFCRSKGIVLKDQGEVYSSPYEFLAFSYFFMDF